MLRELRFVARTLRSGRLATAASVASIGIGIAAVTLALAVADTLLLRPIPGARHEGLFRVEGASPGNETRVVSYPELVALRSALEGAAVVIAERVNVTTASVGGMVMAVGAAVVSPEYFPVLGVPLVAGRGLSGAPRGGSGPSTVVIGEGLWRARLGGDPSVLGSAIRVNGADFTVVGVAGRDFGGAFPGFQVQLWFSIRSLEQVFPQDGSLLAMDDRFLNVVGRLEPGATLAGLRPRLEAATVGLADVDGFPPDRGFVTSTALGVHPALRGLVTRVVTVLLAVALLVFAVSCANVANLSLSRGIRRTPEIATRLALGASSGRVVARLLLESVLLGMLGWGLAVVVTAAAAAAVSSARLPVGVPLALDVPVDGRVLGLGAATGLAAACLFGIVPTIRTLTRARRATLGASFAAADAVGRSMLRTVLMAVQVGTACLLLIAASILLKSVRNLATLDPGFDRHRIVTVGASLEAHEEGEGRRFQEGLLEATRATPEVTSADVGLFVHLGGRSDRVSVNADGVPPGEDGLLVHYSLVGPRYLDVLGIGLVSGRGFDPGGAEAGTAIVNQALADLLWPERDPLGRTLGYALRGEEGSALVVGVTETVKYRRFNESSTPFLYLPAARWYRPDLVIHARGRVPPRELVDVLRRRLASFGASVPLEVRPMADHATMDVVVARILKTVLLASAVAALLIATVGVFGVVAHSTAGRRREMAIRQALGASAGGIRRLVTRQTLRVIGMGTFGGVLLFLPVGRALSGLLYGVPAWDLWSIVGAAGTLFGIGALAAWVPAREATRVEPHSVLRGNT